MRVVIKDWAKFACKMMSKRGCVVYVGKRRGRVSSVDEKKKMKENTVELLLS